MKKFIRTMVLFLLGARVFAVDSVVTFNELMYHPPGTNEANLEWLELYNQMAIDVDLSAWTISGGVQFAFSEGTIIPAHGYLVVASNPSALAAAGFAGALGPFTGRLGNGGDFLELRDRNARLMDALDYNDSGKWPGAPDGSGVALAKRDPNTTSQVAENWTSGVVVGGTPGVRNFPELNATDRYVNLIAMNSSWRFEGSGSDLGTAWRGTNFDDSSWQGELAPNLVSYWPFDGDATAVRGVNGTFSGAVTATTDRNGVANHALAFNGSSFVQVPGGGGLNAKAQGTVALWVKWSGTQDADCCGTFGAVLGRQANGLFSDDIIALNSANLASGRIAWRQSGGPAPVLLTSASVVGTMWHHIAISFAPGGSTLYVDGVAQATAIGSAMHDSASVPLTIGAWSGDGSGFATASIDDVAIWDGPLAASQVAQLASGARTPLSFDGSGTAVYFAGTGTVANAAYPLGQQLPLGPVTHYFRQKFIFDDDLARTELRLTTALDDGAVSYLNGTELYRTNLPAGAVDASTLASRAVGVAPVRQNALLPPSWLVRGTNVLAVEVHQAMANDSDMVFGAELIAIVRPPSTTNFIDPGIAFNEVTAGGNPFQVELINRGTQAVDLAGFVIVRSGNSAPEFTLPSQSLAAGSFAVFDQAALGFTPRNGDRLFLLSSNRQSVLDAVEIKTARRARWPDGTGAWLQPSAATFGASNQFVFQTNVVINEIMYHAPPTLASTGQVYQESSEQWVELFNRGTNTVDLTAWRFDSGIDFNFPAGTQLAPGGYLVVANNPAGMLARYPGLNVLGPFTGKLSLSGDRIVLKDAADNPADEVRYFDDGRWPEAADGGGSSLERLNPFADGSIAEAWVASDETARSSWRTYSYRAACQSSAFGADAWNELDVGLLNAGEVLLDDFHVIQSPGSTRLELLQNGTFTSGTNKWRIIGNHHGSTVPDPDDPANPVLRLVATGPTDHMHNHVETTFTNNTALLNGAEYEISFRAKWISGSRQLLTRAFLSRLARVTILDAPTNHGTPGAMNSAYTANIGPLFSDFQHRPVVPARHSRSQSACARTR